MTRVFLGQTVERLPEPHNIVKVVPGSNLYILPTSAQLYTLATAKPGVRNPEKLAMRVWGKRLDESDSHDYWDIMVDPVTAATALGLAAQGVHSGQTLKITAAGRPPRRHISIEVAPYEEGKA